MRKYLSIILVSILVLVLAACNGGENNDEHANHNEEPGFLEVDFEVPESGVVGEAIEIKATVMYEGGPVTDPEEVQFEIWAAEDVDKENSDKIDGTNNNDGTYTIEYTFDEVGDYEMYAHTTAHDMHIMPKSKITITE